MGHPVLFAPLFKKAFKKYIYNINIYELII